MKRDLSGKAIVITGASSGIGAATAVLCARAGMDVLLSARRADRLDAVAERVRAEGRRAATVVGDVAEPGFSAALLDAAEDELGGFYAVFANAGYGMEKAGHEMESELREMFEVNFFAAHALCAEAARRLIAADRPGHLIMCSSCLAKFTLPYYSAYSASKAAQSHVCRAMAIELAPHRIDVSSVHPVTTETEFFVVSQTRSGHGAVAEDKPAVPGHAPKLFVQTADRVGGAVVACLRRPRPEVWTSFTVRAVAAAMTLVPRFMDMAMRSAMKKDRRGRTG